MRGLAHLAVFLVYAFLFGPMVALVALSFNSARRGAEWQGFTLDWYARLASDPAILEALGNSLWVAAASALISVGCGLCAAWTLVRGRGWQARVFRKAVLLPVFLPDILLGLSLLCFFVWLGLPLGLMSVVLAHSAVGTAYASLTIASRLRALDPLLEDAAADLGASRARVFGQVLLPQLAPALVSGGLMAFTLSFDDFIIAFFTAGVGATTLPLKIYSMLKFGVTPEVNALSSILLCASLVLVGVAFGTQRGSQRRETTRPPA